MPSYLWHAVCCTHKLCHAHLPCAVGTLIAHVQTGTQLAHQHSTCQALFCLARTGRVATILAASVITLARNLHTDTMTKSCSVQTVSVLGAVNNAANSTNPDAPVACTEAQDSTTCELNANSTAIARMRKDIDNLMAGCSQLDHTVISQYLNNPPDGDRMMMDAWRRCGHNDHGRSLNLNLSATAKQTMTPFGMACLIAYARAWLDAAEARQAELRALVRSLGLSQGGGSKCPSGDRSLPSPARPTGKRNRRSKR